MKFGTVRAEKENFRRQAISAGVIEQCIIDEKGFAEMPCITGCFRKGKLWVVYSTDERMQVYDEKEFTDSVAAFKELASRVGFKYKSLNSRTFVVKVPKAFPNFELSVLRTMIKQANPAIEVPLQQPKKRIVYLRKPNKPASQPMNPKPIVRNRKSN